MSPTSQLKLVIIFIDMGYFLPLVCILLLAKSTTFVHIQKIILSNLLL